MGRLKREVWTFCKAQLSAQMATIVDFTVSFLMAEAVGLWYVHASFLGALSGGVFNCGVNYRWVFQSQQLKKKDVALKYMLVWTGSILLNTGGTYLLTEWSGQYFMLAKVVVAVLIAFLWNYPLQRVFVYHDNRLRARMRKMRMGMRNDEMRK